MIYYENVVDVAPLLKIRYVFFFWQKFKKFKINIILIKILFQYFFIKNYHFYNLPQYFVKHIVVLYLHYVAKC